MNIVQITRTFAVASVLVLTATGVWAAGADEEPAAAAAAEKEMVLDPRTGEMVEAPRYGGTLTFATVMPETGAADEAVNGRSGLLLVQGVLEKPSIANWALHRDEWGRSMTSSDTPLWSLTGSLAESWETPDDTTIVLNIRQGVHWHDKPPMNGRELTADDIAFNYHRYLGLGRGFTEVAPGAGSLATVGVESVTATDEWTVVIELERPNPVALFTLLQSYTFDIGPYPLLPPPDLDKEGRVDNQRDTPPNTRLTVQPIRATSIAFNYHRYLGLGRGFTEVAPGAGSLATVGVESVTATDEWTVVIELERPNPVALFTLLLVHVRHPSTGGDRGTRQRQRLEEPGRHGAVHADRLCRRIVCHLAQASQLLGLRRKVPGEPVALH